MAGANGQLRGRSKTMPDEKPTTNTPLAAPGIAAEANAPDVGSAEVTLPSTAAQSSMPAAVAAEEPKSKSSTSRGKTMEIHAPEKPIHSKKEFMFHMFTVILGILIALGFEGIVEWAHHRALVHEARENITVEIEKNKEEIDATFPEYKKQAEDLNHIIDVTHQLEKTHALKPVETLNAAWAVHDLYSTAWQTATTSGAVTYMSYDELRRYTDVYVTQQVFSTLQAQALNHTIDLASLIQTTMFEDQKTVSNEKLQAIAQEAYRQLIVQKTLEDVSTKLSKAYGDLLKHP